MTLSSCMITQNQDEDWVFDHCCELYLHYDINLLILDFLWQSFICNANFVKLFGWTPPELEIDYISLCHWPIWAFFSTKRMMKNQLKLVNILTVFCWPESSALILSFIFDSRQWKIVHEIPVFVGSFMELITQVLWLFLHGMPIFGNYNIFLRFLYLYFPQRKLYDFPSLNL